MAQSPRASINRTAVVIGTSNSLMRQGWVNQLVPGAAASGWTLVNASIGGSSSRLGAYRIETGVLTGNADRVVVDFNINDQMFLEAGSCSQDDLLSHYTTMLMTLHRQGRLDDLLVLLFPHEQVNHAMTDGIVALLTRFHVAHVDFRVHLAEWLAADGLDTAAAYANPRHFNAEYQGRIAGVVMTQLSAGNRTGLRAKAARAWLLAQAPVGYCDLKLHDEGLAHLTVGTSLMKFPVTQFRHRERCLASGAHLLVGALIWATKQSGTLTFRGKDESYRLHFRRSFKGLFLFDSLFTPFALRPQTPVMALNEREARFQRMVGHYASSYGITNATAEVVTLIGANRLPLTLGEDVRRHMTEEPPKTVWAYLRDRVMRR